MRFPTFVVPAYEFRKRSASNESSASAASPELQSQETIISYLRCARCLADLALTDRIISKGFTGRYGQAYLVSPGPSKSATDEPDMPNTILHTPVRRQLATGTHTVSDVSCAQCGSVLGWKYVGANEVAQRYKVGKYILEVDRVCRFTTSWEPPSSSVDEEDGQKEVVEFDSQDEAECQDLFAGVWTPQLAMRRRRAKRLASNRSR